MCLLTSSVDGPTPWSHQLEQVAIRITKVDALAAAFPAHRTLNDYPMLAQPLLPSRQFLSRNGKCEVHLATCVVRRNDPPLNDHGLFRSTLLEKQQHLVLRRLESTETLIADQLLKLQNFLIEAFVAIHFLDIQRTFKNPVLIWQ